MSVDWKKGSSGKRVKWKEGRVERGSNGKWVGWKEGRMERGSIGKKVECGLGCT